MAVSWTQRAAAAGPVPVFAAVGAGGQVLVENLSLDANVEWVASPRHASVLLVAGQPRPADLPALRRVHDQLPVPRATLWWGAAPVADFPAAGTCRAGDDPREALGRLYRGLVSGERAGETHMLADEPPNPWRGLGDRGHGGEGMMGGVPYGRPMPMPPEADLRDGLALDAYTASYGPFLPAWPVGLVLELTLQGDVIQRGRVLRAPIPPLAEPVDASTSSSENRSVEALERARAGHHLRCVARLLPLLELAPWAERCRRAAYAVERGAPAGVAALHRVLERTGALAAIPAGLGRLPPAVAGWLGGPAARAAGEAIDARGQARAYRQARFATVTQTAGDARARVTQWLHEAAQSEALLAGMPAGAVLAEGDTVELPWGRAPDEEAGERPGNPVGDLLAGLEWSEARLLLASFDAAALARLMPAERADTRDEEDAE